jgi:hypothetical protein
MAYIRAALPAKYDAIEEAITTIAKMGRGWEFRLGFDRPSEILGRRSQSFWGRADDDKTVFLFDGDMVLQGDADTCWFTDVACILFFAIATRKTCIVHFLCFERMKK